MDFYILESKKTSASVDQFWKTMSIWINNPHLLNKRVLSSQILFKIQLHSNYELQNIYQMENLSDLIDNDVNKIFSTMKIDNFENLPDHEDPTVFGEGVYLIAKKLFARDYNNFAMTVDFSVVDKKQCVITCFQFSLCPEKRSLGLDWPYRVAYSQESINLSVAHCSSNHPSIAWLKNKVFPSLIKWTESEHASKNVLVKGSLNLIPAEKYCRVYHDLKIKYGLELVKKWPECTDPQKFVYEDIAIATYLLVLWEEERKEKGITDKQSFVDLGCGNGLLVYILTNEGHQGLGIDLRKRKIWELFGHSTKLEERTIIPSSNSLFPDVDWLIGNHSDELTPWIPVIAARSSYNCRFFLLPCCAHEFDGRKFQRDCASNSQYTEYLKYINSVCKITGFITKLDKLRIPSTKRICLIGWTRNYTETDTEKQDLKIEELINARAINKNSLIPDKNLNNEWSHDFKPREVIEKVKNCTQIDKNIINKIINLVADHLLQKIRLINTNNNSEKLWNAGGKIELSEIAKIVPAVTLKQLKNECGGLQTLFRNNSNIFQVVNGSVQFRIPGSQPIKLKKPRKHGTIKFKVKPCWFYNNHPSGCPLSDHECSFKH